MGLSKHIPTLPSASNGNENATTSITQLPVNILEAFIPGYSIISRFLLEVLGFDITVVVSVCFLVFGLLTSIQLLWSHAYRLFKTYYMSFITIESDDDIYAHVIAWVEEQKVSKDAQTLMAKAGLFALDDDLDDVTELPDDLVLLNFKNWGSKIPPRFQPYFGTHRFRYNGRYFEVSISTKQTMTSNWRGMVMQEQRNISLGCIGRSTQPIKDLIRVCQEHYFNAKSSKTLVRRPATKEVRSLGRNPWVMVSARPSRPMDTVVLEYEQKRRVLADINEYLHPATPQWYANRGIPYRRGYLFHGPPGTGKTSLSFAIAGIFGLDIYCISLLEPTLGEEDLGLLFTHLPRRCVVLLEDIDSAGLARLEEPAETSDKPEQKEEDKEKDSDSNASIGLQIVKALNAAREKPAKKVDKNKGISLSGLLNAIDGVASHEGRVLVMTTNHPEKLDDALVRPGRVDMKVTFTLASRSQIWQLFVRMYSADSRTNGLAKNKTGSVKPFSHSSTKSPTAAPKVNTEKDPSSYNKRTSIVPALLSTPPPSPKEQSSLSQPPVDSTLLEDIEAIATAFAAKLPENTFTPAEIQGFLLTRKKEPRRALNEVEAWRDELLEAKREKLGGKGKEEKSVEVMVDGREKPSTKAKEDEVKVEGETENGNDGKGEEKCIDDTVKVNEIS